MHKIKRHRHKTAEKTTTTLERNSMPQFCRLEDTHPPTGPNPPQPVFLHPALDTTTAGITTKWLLHVLDKEVPDIWGSREAGRQA